MILAPANERKGTLKTYEEQWSLCNSDNYDEKYMKIRLNSDEDLPLKKPYNLIIAIRYAFYEGNKYYPLVFLDECLIKV